MTLLSEIKYSQGNGYVGTVLYLTYAYVDHPTGAGCIRAVRFIDGLLTAGYQVVVVSMDKEPSLKEVAPGLIACRVGDDGRLPDEMLSAKGLGRWPFLKFLPGPDVYGRVNKGVYRACGWLVKTYRPELVYVMTPPCFSLNAVGFQVPQKYDLPFVMELDDAWAAGMYWPYRNFIRRYLADKWERRCLMAADKVVTVTETHREILIGAYGDEMSDKILTIRHSYDPLIMNCDRGQNTKDVGTGDKNSPFRMAYVGQVRGVDMVGGVTFGKVVRRIWQMVRKGLLGANFCEKIVLEWMSPHYLIEAMGQVAQQDKDFGRRVRLDFVGESYEQIDQWARKANLPSQITQHGPMSQERAQKYVDQADVLLVNLYGLVGHDYHWCVPTKIYTYLATGKPILSLMPPGEACDLIKEAGVGFFARPDDVEGIVRQLKRLFEQHQGDGIEVKPNWELIRQFDIAKQQQKFVEIVQSLSAP
ncbi:MAG: glycosyltransferase [Phycisphaerae bacterium]|nr:glycosyltransferase [Phycisphaerae bacterium]